MSYNLVCHANSSIHSAYGEPHDSYIVPQPLPPSNQKSLIDYSLKGNRLTQSGDGSIKLIPHHPAFVLGQCLRSCYEKTCEIANYLFENETITINTQTIETNEIIIAQIKKKIANELSLSTDKDHSHEQMEDRLLAKLMACDSDSRYHKASFFLSSEGCDGFRISDEIVENVRKIMELSCRSKQISECSQEKYNSKENYVSHLFLQKEDLLKIEQRWERPRSSEMTSVARKLLNLQRKYSETHYIFSHGMSRMHAAFPAFITELDHRLWPKRKTNGFIFARAVPPNKKLLTLREIFPKLRNFPADHSKKFKSDLELRSELLCLDIDLLNLQHAESAFSFFEKNYSICNEVSEIICNIFKTFAQEFEMKFSETLCYSKFLDDKNFNTWSSQNFKQLETGTGAMLVIAVPKPLLHDQDSNFVYTSLPFGIPVNKSNPLSQVEELVRIPTFDTGVSARILTSHLKPEKGIKSFWTSEFKDQSLGSLERNKAFSNLAEEFFKKIETHCRSYSSSQRLMNPECARLLSETASETEG